MVERVQKSESNIVKLDTMKGTWISSTMNELVAGYISIRIQTSHFILEPISTTY